MLSFFQFNSYDPVDGRITEWEFADMLLTYSSFHEKKKQRILRKVKKFFKENSQVEEINSTTNKTKLWLNKWKLIKISFKPITQQEILVS